MLTNYARRLLSRQAATVFPVADADGWKPRSGSGVRKPPVKLVFAPRKTGVLWMVRVRGKIVFESPDKATAISHRDALLSA
jgi:hypothetical protein